MRHMSILKSEETEDKSLPIKLIHNGKKRDKYSKENIMVKKIVQEEKMIMDREIIIIITEKNKRININRKKNVIIGEMQ